MKRLSKNNRKKDSIYKNLKRFRLHHQILFTLIGIIGVILIWRGVWTLSDQNPFLQHPLVSIVLGLILVIMAGFFFKVA